MASFTAAKAALDEMVAPVTASMSSMVRGSAARPRNWSVKSGSCTFVPLSLIHIFAQDFGRLGADAAGGAGDDVDAHEPSFHADLTDAHSLVQRQS